MAGHPKMFTFSAVVMPLKVNTQVKTQVNTQTSKAQALRLLSLLEFRFWVLGFQALGFEF